MNLKVVAALLIALPSVCFAEGYLPLPGTAVDNPQAIASLNNSLGYLYTSKLDLRPRNILPKTDGQYDLGSSAYRWSGTYVEFVESTGTIHVTGARTPASGKGIEIYYPTDLDAGYILAYDRTNSQYKPLLLYASKISFMQGNVGIGTTTPADLLTLSGGSSVARIRFVDTANHTWMIGSDSTNSFLLRDVTASANRINVDGTGNVGIGIASPGAKLHIKGNGITIEEAADTANWNMYVESTSNDIRFYNGTVDSPQFQADGDAYFVADVSALTFTDRTPYPKDKAEAYSSVLSMEAKPGGGVDHEKLDKFILAVSTRSEVNSETQEKETIVSIGRNLSATVSAQNEVIKDLIKRIEALEKK